MNYWIWIIGLWSLVSVAQIKTTTFAEIEQLMEQQPRPLLVFFYTDWCSYCELMKQKTFADPKIIQELNENYYVIFFDGESKEPLKWNNQNMAFKKSGLKSGSHQLTTHFAEQKGRVTYPSLVFLDSNFQKVFQQNTYLKASELHALLEVIY
ncbi:thioredoxin fold domain-containing protein [Flavobacterium sp. NKUCC04_CG]|uniref:thioredoxin family protein n=1 Tax=Flavobacterium sp. NKUCC04_CG TaxID=2842121 RepID=UPI001C5BD205|nr:thioredoxin fold domain-containing protein [Flavobacterium sp. NKUCC04_CG]MBW3518450.1 thioredoxin family protein [Flavobacterium sp. NKUCC04_CG]